MDPEFPDKATVVATVDPLTMSVAVVAVALEQQAQMVVVVVAATVVMV